MGLTVLLPTAVNLEKSLKEVSNRAPLERMFLTGFIARLEEGFGNQNWKKI